MFYHVLAVFLFSSKIIYKNKDTYFKENLKIIYYFKKMKNYFYAEDSNNMLHITLIRCNNCGMLCKTPVASFIGQIF